MDWLEYVKGELINKGWSKPSVRASEGLIAEVISIYCSYDGQFDAIVAAEAILRKAKIERTTAQGHNFNAGQTLYKARKERDAAHEAEKKQRSIIRPQNKKKSIQSKNGKNSKTY